jgi:hypothetical protein
MSNDYCPILNLNKHLTTGHSALKRYRSRLDRIHGLNFTFLADILLVKSAKKSVLSKCPSSCLVY